MNREKESIEYRQMEYYVEHSLSASNRTRKQLLIMAIRNKLILIHILHISILRDRIGTNRGIARAVERYIQQSTLVGCALSLGPLRISS